MEFQVLIHGKDVIENVLSDTGDDAHLVRVVQLALQRQSQPFLSATTLKARAFFHKCIYTEQILSSNMGLLVVCYLHGVSLPGGGLSICENSAIVSTQNIYQKKQSEKRNQDCATKLIPRVPTCHHRSPTFDDLLGRGVVHLLLGGVGGEHPVEGEGLPLQCNTNRQQSSESKAQIRCPLF